MILHTKNLLRPSFKGTIIISLAMLLLLRVGAAAATAATYKGQNIDGKEYQARAYSYGTHSYYYVKVIFDGAQAKVYFEGGEYIYLSLNNSDIVDPHDIFCYDYEKHVNWSLNVDGLDECAE
jgi:hypothetical protein